MDSIKAILIDIGGVLYVGDKTIDGAIEAIDSLKKRYKIKLLTNTTQRTSKEIFNEHSRLFSENTHNKGL